VWWGLGSSTGLLVGCGLMGSPYPDSTHQPWVGGWLGGTQRSFPAVLWDGGGFVIGFGTLLGPEKTAASSGASRVLWSPPWLAV
jgi:hypothetical protein